MSGFIHCNHIFGIRNDVYNSPVFQDEHTALIASAGKIVRYRLDGLPHKFVANNEKNSKCSTTTAIALSATKRHLALAEKNHDVKSGKNSKLPYIVIFDLLHNASKRQRVLHLDKDEKGEDNGSTSTEIVSLDFSADGKYLIAQTNGPDWMLYMWQWDKNKLLSHTKTTNPAGNMVRQATFSPLDSTHICVTGHNIQKFLRFTEGALKQTGNQKIEPKDYKCHTWMSNGYLLLGGNDEKVYVMVNGDLKETIDLSNLETFGDHFGGHLDKNDKNLENRSFGMPVSVTSLCAFGNSFAVSNNFGLTYIFELDLETHKLTKNLFVLHKTIFIEENKKETSNTTINLLNIDPVIQITASPANEILIGLTHNRQLYQFNLATSLLNEKESYWEKLGPGSHSASIRDLSVCTRKPLIATCGDDRTVRVWNYENQHCEIYKKFPDDVSCCSIHPLGLFLLLGCTDKLKMMNLLIDDLSPSREFPVRSCKMARFSNGGHMFAVLHGNVIIVYWTSKLESIVTLTGHGQHVKCLTWSKYDDILVSCGSDGAIYQWNALKGERVHEVVNRGVDYTYVTINKNNRIWACSSDGFVREIFGSETVRKVKLDNPFTCITVCDKTVIGTTEYGTLCCLQLPLSDPCQFTEFVGHSSSINRVVSIPNHKNLVSASTDGSLIYWSSFERDPKLIGRTASIDKMLDDKKPVEWIEEVLVTRFDLEEKNREISEYKTRVEELKMENEYQIRLKDMHHNEKVNEIESRLIKEIDHLKTNVRITRIEKEGQAKRYEAEIEEICGHARDDLFDRDNLANSKLIGEYDKYQELLNQHNEAQRSFESRITIMEEEKQEWLEKTVEKYDETLEEKHDELLGLNAHLEQQAKEFEEQKRQIEEDGDQEILELRVRYERNAREKLDEIMNLKGENGILKKKDSTMLKQIKMLKIDKNTLTNEMKEMHNVIAGRDKDICALKKERQERDETITEKESRIKDLTKKTHELEKFKFVLDYKIKELNKQIEPRENEIKHNKQVIREMEIELTSSNKLNEKLGLEKGNMKGRLSSTVDELLKERIDHKDSKTVLDRLKDAVYKCANQIQDPKLLKSSIVQMCGDYCSADASSSIKLVSSNHSNLTKKSEESVQPDGDLKTERMEDKKAQEQDRRHREHLEQRLEHLKRTTVREKNNQKKGYTKVMKQNVDLLTENNKLRGELKNSRCKNSDLQIALGIKNSVGKNNKNRKFVDTVTRDYTLPLRVKDDRIGELENIIQGQQRQIQLNAEEKLIAD